MKGKKNIFTYVMFLILSIFIAGCTSPTILQFTDSACFEFDPSWGAITRYKCDNGIVVIPEKVNGTPVTYIGIGAFTDNNFITSVTIPNSVIGIGGNAFYNCQSLESVTILCKVDLIHLSTFEGCKSLQTIVIPKTVTYIDSLAFYGCDSLTSITIGSFVVMEHNAFSNGFIDAYKAHGKFGGTYKYNEAADKWELQ